MSPANDEPNRQRRRVFAGEMKSRFVVRSPRGRKLMLVLALTAIAAGIVAWVIVATPSSIAVAISFVGYANDVLAISPSLDPNQQAEPKSSRMAVFQLVNRTRQTL